jgi:hypothetical protein
VRWRRCGYGGAESTVTSRGTVISTGWFAVLAWARLLKFPNLSAANYTITSPENRDYNCAAWAAGDDQAWWWPSPDVPECYWPTSRRDGSLEAITEGFGALGYSACESPELESDYEKVAIFANDDGPTHVARQLSTGRWTSKLGKLEDIDHSTLADIECDLYGRPVLFMRRPLAEQEEANT